MIYNVLECNFSTEDAVLLLRMHAVQCLRMQEAKTLILMILKSHSVPTCPNKYKNVPG